MKNTAVQLYELGQSVWYDNIRRGLLDNGELVGMIERGEIYGVTSNPSIFMKAITKSTDYDDSLDKLKGAELDPEAAFFVLAIEDIQEAADLFKSLYKETEGGDGFVSLEVSPYLANQTEKTIQQAKELWQRVDRPNLMVKIPATKAGLPAIEEAIFAGVNVNVTLIFSLKRYQEVMEAYIRGLERRAELGLPLGSIASVASFFVSRIDTNVDNRLQKIVESNQEVSEKAQGLMGNAAIASAKLAYRKFKEMFTSDRFQKLNEKGAKIQRPLWASTSTKNPAYKDVIYVEELIGSYTVNTMPPHTLKAFLDYGLVEETLEADVDAAQGVFNDLESIGVSMDDVTDELLEDGVKSFADSFTELLKSIKAHNNSK